MTTPISGLEEIAQNQANKYLTHNTALRKLEALAHRVLSRTTLVQPGSPADGDVYILPSGATGFQWGYHSEHDVMIFTAGAWIKVTPWEGLSFWVNDTDTTVTFDSSTWVLSGGGGGGGAEVPDTPTIAGSTDYRPAGTDAPFGVYVVGDFAYCTGSTLNAVTVFDVSDPTTPVIMDDVFDNTNLNTPKGVHTVGDYAYVACNGGNSLTVIDVRDPTNITIAGQIIDGTNLLGAHGVFVSGNYAYVACLSGDSLTVVDITDPTVPVVAGQVINATTLNGAVSVKVVGNYAYVACFNGNGVAVVDITDPTAPVVASNVVDATNLNAPTVIHVSGKYAYVGCFTGNSLTVVDIEDPNALSVAGQVIDATQLNGVFGLFVSGNYAYVGCFTGDRITVVDVTDPTTPVVIGTITDGTDLDGVYNVFVSGNYLYTVAGTGDRFTVIDIQGSSFNALEAGNFKVGFVDAQDVKINDLTVKTGAHIAGNCRIAGRLSLGGVEIITGTGTPESAVVAVVGSMFLRTNGGASTTQYIKESGTGNTGWIAK